MRYQVIDASNNVVMATYYYWANAWEIRNLLAEHYPNKRICIRSI